VLKELLSELVAASSWWKSWSVLSLQELLFPLSESPTNRAVGESLGQLLRKLLSERVVSRHAIESIH
jgi:hypothetical protein